MRYRRSINNSSATRMKTAVYIWSKGVKPREPRFCFVHGSSSGVAPIWLKIGCVDMSTTQKFAATSAHPHADGLTAGQSSDPPRHPTLPVLHVGNLDWRIWYIHITTSVFMNNELSTILQPWNNASSHESGVLIHHISLISLNSTVCI